MDVVIKGPNLQELRRWILLTSTADWLYDKYGFTKLTRPDMELYNPNVYKKYFMKHNENYDLTN